jgi:hypothetical protein
MVGAQLGYDNLVLWIGANHCKWQADIIIVVLWRLSDAVMPTEDVVGDLSCHCFAHRAGYRNHLEAALPAVRSGKITEGFYGIVNRENRAPWPGTHDPSFVDHRADGTFGKGIGNIIMAVKIFARYGKKAVAGFCGSRVDTYASETVTRDSWPVARISFNTGFYYPC